jgi:hypothetical protein
MNSMRRNGLAASALALLGAVALGGCPGEVALDEEREVRLGLQTPELEGSVELSDEDATALGVDQRVWAIDEGPYYGHVVIPTGLTHTSSQKPEYCFAEPVLIVPEAGPGRTLVQAGECFEGSTVMNRVDVKFASPSPGDVVRNQVEVQVVDEVGDPESDVRFFVDGELSSSEIERDGRAVLDLSGMEAGSIGVRVEVVAPSGRVLAASVIHVVNGDVRGQ